MFFTLKHHLLATFVLINLISVLIHLRFIFKLGPILKVISRLLLHLIIRFLIVVIKVSGLRSAIFLLSLHLLHLLLLQVLVKGAHLSLSFQKLIETNQICS
jgi:hypothetical protein